MTKPLSTFTVIAIGLLINSTASAAHGNYCSATARTMATACAFDAADDYFVKKANCINISDHADRRECYQERRDDFTESREECREQRAARLDLCDQVGEQRYDPEIDPADFVDPTDIGVGVAVSPFFPLVAGNRWVYEGDGETITVVVTEKTKLIAGVTTVVVNDVVLDEDGVLVEDTDDWYAQDTDGNIWYFGEIAKNYELFDGDDPEEAELVDIDGSFKAEVDHAKAGILIKAVPVVGDVLQQEFALGEAEDVAETISTTASESTSEASCVNTCLETSEYTPLEPGIFETKYFAPGVGLILEIDDEGNRIELVEFANP